MTTTTRKSPIRKTPARKGFHPSMEFTDPTGNLISVEAVVITPAAAETMLKQNAKNNRDISPDNLAKLMNDLEDGKFVVTGTSVVFNCDNVLIDGQTRLTAIVKTGVPAMSLVAARKYLTEVRPMIRTGGTQLPDLFRVIDTMIRLYNGWRGGASRVTTPNLSAAGIRYISDLEKATGE